MIFFISVNLFIYLLQICSKLTSKSQNHPFQLIWTMYIWWIWWIIHFQVDRVRIPKVQMEPLTLSCASAACSEIREAVGPQDVAVRSTILRWHLKYWWTWTCPHMMGPTTHARFRTTSIWDTHLWIRNSGHLVRSPPRWRQVRGAPCLLANKKFAVQAVQAAHYSPASRASRLNHCKQPLRIINGY